MSQKVAMNLTLLSSSTCFGGQVQKFKHLSSVLGGTTAHFSVFLPPNTSNKTPVLYWLSGLTCTEDNFIQKAGAQRAASKYGLALICPDTSPRLTN